MESYHIKILHAKNPVQGMMEKKIHSPQNYHLFYVLNFIQQIPDITIIFNGS